MIIRFDCYSGFAAHMQDWIEAAAKNAGYSTDFGVSNSSCAHYLEVWREDEDGETGEVITIRVSDHNVVNPASRSDFYIGFADFQFATVYLPHTVIYERSDAKPIEFDEDGDPLEWDYEYVECDEMEEDAEMACIEFYTEDINGAVKAAIDFIAKEIP